MAPKKKGKDKKGKKGGKKKKLGLSECRADELCKKLLKTYNINCKDSDNVVIPYVKRLLKDCVENNQLWVKIIVEPLPQLTKDDRQVRLEPLISSIRSERYTFIKDIYIWDLPLSHETVATLALLIDKGFYQIRLLEIQDCLLEPRSVARLALSFNYCKTLTIITLDYNEFGDQGCQGLCNGLSNNKTILSLSLCYCDLGVLSGKMLGNLVANTPICNLFLDGNNLGCDGVIDLVKQCADFAEHETFQKLEDERRKLEEEQAAKEKGISFDSDSKPGSASSNYKPGSANSEKPGSAGSKKGGKGKAKKGKKKKGKKKKKEKPGPPPSGPFLHKLHLADNGVDVIGEDLFAPIVCMRVVKKWIIYSSCLEEIDLDKNLIGDLGARIIMEALNERKNAKLPSMGVKVTHRISDDVYSTINKLGTGVKKKKGRKGKKGKKKK